MTHRIAACRWENAARAVKVKGEIIKMTRSINYARLCVAELDIRGERGFFITSRGTVEKDLSAFESTRYDTQIRRNLTLV